VRPAAFSNPSWEATRRKPVVPRNQPKRSNGDRSTAAEGDGVDRSWFHARQINRRRSRHRANQERSRTVFVRATDTNPRASNGYSSALPHRLPVYLQQRLSWVPAIALAVQVAIQGRLLRHNPLRHKQEKTSEDNLQ
jgi:hypothetical protein